MTRLSELPPNLRRQIADGQARPAKARTRATPATPPAGRSHWTCHACAEPFDQWAPAERHLDDVHGGGRMELVLEVAK